MRSLKNILKLIEEVDFNKNQKSIADAPHAVQLTQKKLKNFRVNHLVRSNLKQTQIQQKSNLIKQILPYLLVPILTLVLLTFFLQLWKVDLRQPIFGYGEDTFFYLFVTKNVVTSGWWYSSEFVGFPNFGEKFYLHDFAHHAEAFSFLIIKAFSYFSSNPFLILNCFFIATFALISASSFAVLKSFKISNFTAILISSLYAFAFYHFYRNVVGHAFLANYATIPLVVMVALWIIFDKINLVEVSQKKQFYLAPNYKFFIGLLVLILVAFSGVYYASYSCLIFAFAWFLSCLKSGNFFNRKIAVVFTFFFVAIVSQFLIYLPAIFYWIDHGLNAKVMYRSSAQSIYAALKIAALLLPNENHYFSSWADFAKMFKDLTVVEAKSESLGVLASLAFLFLLFWLFAKSQDGAKSFLQKIIHKFSLDEKSQNLISGLAGLNLLVVLYSTVAGFVMFVAVFFPMLRSHNRFSIFIAFFALFLTAIFCDKFLQKKKTWAKILVLIIFFLSLLDQTGKVSASIIQTPETKIKFASEKNFVEKIENNLPQNSKIFMLPFVNFPEAFGGYSNLVGHLHSKNLRWSYPAMRGRQSSLWQEEVVKLDFKNFISQLKKAGFAGVFINREIYEEVSGLKLEKIENALKKVSAKKDLISEDKRMAFFEID